MLFGYTNRLTAALKKLDQERVKALVEALETTRSNGGTVWICGNGGSAATAQHMEVDLSFGVTPPVRAIALSSNSSGITATGNDVNFTSIYSRQLEIHATPGDLLIVISASGNSTNLVEAVKWSKAAGVTSAGLLGFDGGILLELVDISVWVPTAIGDYGVAEDIHAILNHALKEIMNGGMVESRRGVSGLS